MIDRGHDLALATQADLLGVARSTLYRQPRPVPAADLAVMRRIDELHLDYPFAGSRMMRDMLVNEGVVIGRTHVRTLMRRMGIEALYRRPRTSKPAPGHKVYPYLLRDLAIERPNQVWATDITYIPMARGFVYLVVVLDWFSRRALSWRVSITLETDFCIEAVEEALARHGKPDIFNTDQGSQFTSAEFTDLLLNNRIAISMDGKGAWRDNVFVERLWRTVKHEEVYLKAYEGVPEARTSISRYLDFYNAIRPHSRHGGQTPDRVWFASLPAMAAAA
jgi:putative transposase